MKQTLFSGENSNLWIVVDLGNEHVKQLDRASLTGAFIGAETKA